MEKIEMPSLLHLKHFLTKVAVTNQLSALHRYLLDNNFCAVSGYYDTGVLLTITAKFDLTFIAYLYKEKPIEFSSNLLMLYFDTHKSLDNFIKEMFYKMQEDDFIR